MEKQSRNLNSARFLATLAAIALGFPVTAAEWGGSPREFAHEAITKLGGTEIPCKFAETVLGPGEIAVCASLPPSTKRFKKLWRSVAHGRGRPQISLEPETVWLADAAVLFRYYRSDIVPIGVFYDSATRDLLIAWTDVIYCNTDEWKNIATGLPECGDVSEAVTINDLQCPMEASKTGRVISIFHDGNGESWYMPEYPHKTAVEIKAIISTDGSVGRVCVAKTIHKNFYFIFSFTTRVRRRQYEPARKDGEPVVVVIDDDYWAKSY